jgi:hypothetical protein
MSIFALVISRGSSNLAFPYIWAKGAAVHGNISVELLLPKGGRRLWLSCSGCSAVLAVDADGGPPDGDFPKEGGGRVAAGRCPYELILPMAGAVSDLICEAGNEL